MRFSMLLRASQTANLSGYDVADESEENWDLCWSDLSVNIERVSKLRRFQRLNHFCSMLEICRKAALSRHMQKMALKLPQEYSFHPVSFNLPDQLEELIVVLRKNKAKVCGVNDVWRAGTRGVCVCACVRACARAR